MLTDLQLEIWKQIKLDSAADSAWTDYMPGVDAGRVKVQAEILDLLKTYLSGAVTTEDLKATFDRRTRKEWIGFGLKGPSGAMFLNKLVKHIPDATELTAELRKVIPVPQSVESGRTSMRGFVDYLLSAIRSGKATKSQLDPARASFLVSCVWHLQNTETWPIFYPSGRRVLESQQLYTPQPDIVEDYFSFRDAFLALASALELKSWSLEHLLDWYDKRTVKPKDEGREPPKQPTDEDADEQAEDGAGEEEESSHTQIQWLLATIGKKLGCKVWIASNDQKKEWNGQRLSELSIDKLPFLGMGAASQDIVRLIDVVWLKGTQVTAAFEIEHTTSVYSGLLRMSDLTLLSPNLSFRLYIVAPERRLDKVRRELSRPTFQELELHKRCGFFSDERLIEQAEAIKQWANNPSDIDRLAERVPDVNGGE